VEIADLHLGIHNPFSIELGDDSDDPVHGRVRGTDVDEHLPGFRFSWRALRRLGEIH
jgi:hypothetical protein